MKAFNKLLKDVRACTICASVLTHPPRPVLQLHPNAKILIAGQAPGRKVQESGIPFDDVSGNRLRDWMGIDKKTFYDHKKIAILPMGFCFPGTDKSGDLPPRPECAPEWRESLLNQLPKLELTIILGQYAQKYHFGRTSKNLTELVKDWQDYWPEKIPLPHPSPRNNIWLHRNPWFEMEVIPELQKKIQTLLN